MRKLPKGLFKSRERTGIIRDEPGYRDPKELRQIAIHEAGHAVAAVVYEFELNSVSIKRRPLPNGRVSQGFTDAPIIVDFRGKPTSAAVPRMIQALAGAYAEGLSDPDSDSMSSFDLDIAESRKLAALAVCQPTPTESTWVEISSEEQTKNALQIDSLLKSAGDATVRFVEEHSRAIIAVAMALEERRELSGAEVAAIVEAVGKGA